jgi:hypothetical protein
MGTQLPRSLRGDVGAVAMGAVADFDVKQDMGPKGGGGVNARSGFESLYEQGVRDILHGTGRETFDAVKMLKAANPQRFPPANGAQYPRGRLGESLKQIAQLIKADVGLEVAFADAGAGTPTPIRATRGDSSPSASPSSPRAWPRCTVISAIAWPTWWS